MKKCLVMMMTAILAVSMLAGCGSSGKETTAPETEAAGAADTCLLYTSPSPRD